MTAETWKSLVLAIVPAALVLREHADGPTGRVARHVVRRKVDGDIVGISMLSSADAWRVAHVNLTSKRPPGEGAGTQLLI